MGISPLGEGHGAGVIPYVDDFAHPPHPGRRILWALIGNRIDIRLVHLQMFAQSRAFRLGLLPNLQPFHPRFCKQFCVGADTFLVPGLFANPDRQRGAPVPFPRQGPVHIALKEIAETAITDMFRLPLDMLVIFQESLAEIRGADEPASACILNQRVLFRSRTEWIGMADLFVAQHEAALLEQPDNRFVGMLAELACERFVIIRVRIGNPAVESAVRVYKAQETNPLLATDAVVVLAKCGGDVNNTGSRGKIYKIPGNNDPVFIRGLAGQHIDRDIVVEERLIMKPHEFSPFEAPYDVRRFTEIGLRKRFSEYQVFVLAVFG
ncbi:MAG: hypothetical protein BWX80_03955 [Candidatus Hydrogenedentes bacterium ADurb.Bin101]|nr:MAG: hypothetical protein BWX80_03955 [Candidatus Hydrogenedentes bacterium ADurb.Bin101]